MGMLGGMMMASDAATEVSPAVNAAGYPFATMAGMMMLPIAATSATAEPEISAKNIEEATLTMPSPPDMPHQRRGHIDDAQGDACRTHDAAGQDEQRDSQQWKLRRTREQVQRDDRRGGAPAGQQGDQHSGDEGKADRHPQRRQRNDEPDHHPAHRRTRAARRRSSMRTIRPALNGMAL